LIHNDEVETEELINWVNIKELPHFYKGYGLLINKSEAMSKPLTFDNTTSTGCPEQRGFLEVDSMAQATHQLDRFSADFTRLNGSEDLDFDLKCQADDSVSDESNSSVSKEIPLNQLKQEVMSEEKIRTPIRKNRSAYNLFVKDKVGVSHLSLAKKQSSRPRDCNIERRWPNWDENGDV
jgi:hypothetical protein